MMQAVRILFVAWQDPRTGEVLPVGRLLDLQVGGSALFEFAYVGGVQKALEKGFQPFLDFPGLNEAYRGPHLFPLFQNRLMARSRPDFHSYLQRLGLGGDPTPLEILARGGKRATDKLELFGMPFPDWDRRVLIYHFWLRRIRSTRGAERALAMLAQGDPLLPKLDVGNTSNPHAVVLCMEKNGHRAVIGYLPDYLLEDVHLLGVDNLRVHIAHINRPQPGPALANIPNVPTTAFCVCEAYWDGEFRPFSTAQFIPLAVDAVLVDSAVVPQSSRPAVL